jgi:hypothetical protein
MTVTVSDADYYVVGCAECCTEIERITRAAIRDFSVTKLTFTPGHRHNHEVDKGKALAAPQPPAPPSPPSGELFVEGTAGNSAGALNGFDHAAGQKEHSKQQ